MARDFGYSQKRFRNNWKRFRNDSETIPTSKRIGNATGPQIFPETIQKQFRLQKELGMPQDLRYSQKRFRNHGTQFRNNSETILNLKTIGNGTGPQIRAAMIQKHLETIWKQFRNNSEFEHNWECHMMLETPRSDSDTFGNNLETIWKQF